MNVSRVVVTVVTVDAIIGRDTTTKELTPFMSIFF